MTRNTIRGSGTARTCGGAAAEGGPSSASGGGGGRVVEVAAASSRSSSASLDGCTSPATAKVGEKTAEKKGVLWSCRVRPSTSRRTGVHCMEPFEQRQTALGDARRVDDCRLDCQHARYTVFVNISRSVRIHRPPAAGGTREASCRAAL